MGIGCQTANAIGQFSRNLESRQLHISGQPRIGCSLMHAHTLTFEKYNSIMTIWHEISLWIPVETVLCIWEGLWRRLSHYIVSGRISCHLNPCSTVPGLTKWLTQELALDCYSLNWIYLLDPGPHTHLVPGQRTSDLKRREHKWLDKQNIRQLFNFLCSGHTMYIQYLSKSLITSVKCLFKYPAFLF